MTLAEIRTVRLKGFSMNYIRFGDGLRTLVILPGLSVGSVLASADAIREAYAPMTEDYTVFLFDRRNELPPVYPVAEMARDTERVMRELGITRADLFGASQGGMSAMTIAINAPDLVRCLALGSTAAKIEAAGSRLLVEWVRLARSGDAEGLFLSFAQSVYPAGVFSAVRDSLRAAAESVTSEEAEQVRVVAWCGSWLQASSLRPISRENSSATMRWGTEKPSPQLIVSLPPRFSVMSPVALRKAKSL